MGNFLQLGNRLIPVSSIGYIDLQHAREGSNGTCVRVWLNTVNLGPTVLQSNTMPAYLDFTGNDAQSIRRHFAKLGDTGVVSQVIEASEPAARAAAAKG
jgi:hypothetical protein